MVVDERRLEFEIAAGLALVREKCPPATRELIQDGVRASMPFALAQGRREGAVPLRLAGGKEPSKPAVQLELLHGFPLFRLQVRASRLWQNPLPNGRGSATRSLYGAVFSDFCHRLPGMNVGRRPRSFGRSRTRLSFTPARRAPGGGSHDTHSRDIERRIRLTPAS